jgi:hypothetical protein
LLIEKHEGLAVSIYMPTHRTGDIEQDPILLKNLLREAEQRLADGGLRTPEARQLLEPAWKLVADSFFWRYQGDGLAIFIASGFFRYYRLPYNFAELLVVAERLHIKPLFPFFVDNRLFYILAVSQKRVRLLQCTGENIREVTPESVPSSLAEALRYDDPEKQIQFHTGTTASSGNRPAIFHGQGAGVDDAKDRVLRYFQQIDGGLHELLREERAPLVLAAVDYLRPLYRQANSYPHLLGEGIIGNPDEAKLDLLAQQSWNIVRPYFEREQAEAISRYREASGTGLTTNDVEQAVHAAYEGRIATLFAALDAQRWGSFDPTQRRIEVHEEAETGDEDLLDFATVHTLIKGGTTYVVQDEQIPGNGPIAAILRYGRQ